MKITRKYVNIKQDDEHIHEKFQMFRRLDTKHWSETKFLIGAILFSWLKITGVLTSTIGMYLGIKFVLWGKDVNDAKVITDKIISRRIGFVVRTFGKLMIFSFGLILKVRKVDYDYSRYLGKNYENCESKSKATTYVSNHTSWIDIIIMAVNYNTGFISKESIKFAPIIGYIAKAIGCIFVDRDNKDNRVQVLSQIQKKQKEISTGEDPTMIHIFTEGTTSNATGIMPFKQGAFSTKLPVKPFVIKFDPINRISLAMDVIEGPLHMFIVLCIPFHYLELYELPTFTPNEYLFTISPLAKENKTEWLIYAETVREVMTDASNLKKNEGSYEMKNEYLNFLRNNKQT